MAEAGNKVCAQVVGTARAATCFCASEDTVRKGKEKVEGGQRHGVQRGWRVHGWSSNLFDMLKDGE